MRARSMTVGWVAAAMAVGALLFAGCGYSTGLGLSRSYDSIGVEFFGNQTLERDIELPLYDQISRALRDFGDVSLTEPSHAQVVVRGTIREYHFRSGIRSKDNELLETGVFVEIEGSLFSRATGKVLSGPARAYKWVGFVVTGSKPPEFPPPDFVASSVDRAKNERDARDRALRVVADELVLQLFAPEK